MTWQATSPHRASPLANMVVDTLAAIVGEAHQDAALVAGFLGNWTTMRTLGWTPGRPVPIVRERLIELGTVLRLARWEHAGITQHFGESVPSARPALQAVVEGILADWAAGKYTGPRGPDPARVFAVWCRWVAWAASGTLGATMAVSASSVDEDSFVDLIARLVWRNRRAGTRTLPQSGGAT